MKMDGKEDSKTDETDETTRDKGCSETGNATMCETIFMTLESRIPSAMRLAVARD